MKILNLCMLVICCTHLAITYDGLAKEFFRISYAIGAGFYLSELFFTVVDKYNKKP